MGIKNKISEGFSYFLTFTVVDWVDIFTRPCYRHIIIDSLKYCQENKGLNLHAWCLMSNHLHLIVSAKENHHLSDIIRDFKKFSSKAIIKAIQENPESRKKWMLNRFEFAGRYNPKIKDYKFWKDGNEAKEIHSNSFLEQKLTYIHNNPVVAEIVENPEEYIYSSAKNYYGEQGLLDIIPIE
jgi:REP-associated tyrosine transposase